MSPTVFLMMQLFVILILVTATILLLLNIGGNPFTNEDVRVVVGVSMLVVGGVLAMVSLMMGGRALRYTRYVRI